MLRLTRIREFQYRRLLSAFKRKNRFGRMEAWKAGGSTFAPPTILRRENMDVKFLGFTGFNSAYRLDRDLTDLQLQQERPRRNCSFQFHSLRTWKIIDYCAKNLSHWVFSDFFSEAGWQLLVGKSGLWRRLCGHYSGKRRLCIKKRYAFLKVSQSIPKFLTVARRVPMGTSLPP